MIVMLPDNQFSVQKAIMDNVTYKYEACLSDHCYHTKLPVVHLIRYQTTECMAVDFNPG